MNNPNIKLFIEITNPANSQAKFTLQKGAQLDVGVISPKRLMELHDGTFEPSTLEEKAQTAILKTVMGECTQTITGICTLKEAVELIRALNHRQEVELNINQNLQ